jgi:hypothetical protein
VLLPLPARVSDKNLIARPVLKGKSNHDFSFPPSCGIVLNTRADHAVVMVTALAHIFGSTASEQEQWQAAVAYVRDELAVEREAANWWPGESDTQLDFFVPPMSADPVLGLAVRPPAACRQCGDPVATVGPGKPPHYASLRCRSCNLHRGWLSRVHHANLTEVINTAGAAPREPIVLHTALQNRSRRTTESVSFKVT